ncbi:MAG TPA: PIN domain-containing protein [Candidatus Dormibacteraeota bacterium]
MLGVIGGFILGYAMVRSSDARPPASSALITLTTLEGLIFAYLGTPYLLGGWRQANRRLTLTPLPDLVAALFGMIVGLVLAVLIGYFVRDFPYGVGLSAVLAALLAVTGARLGLTRRQELLALALGGRGEETESRIAGVLLDTSVIIDGRILDLVRTGFIDAPLYVPRSVVKELQFVADSADPIRRNRGRRGLEVLTELKDEPKAALRFHDDDTSGSLDIDARLVRLAQQTGWAVMTNDFNLNRVARLEGVNVLNLNELANALKPIAIPGEDLTVNVVKEGKEPGQGVAYLDDGTMVVIENGRRHLNGSILVTVTSILQTAAGRMIFAAPSGQDGQAGARRRQRAAQ